MMTLSSILFLFVLFCVHVCGKERFVVAPVKLTAAPYPEWAHYHWVWLSNDRASQSAMMEYAKEYMDHNITVGAVNIDSTWSSGFNNFIFNFTKYPDPKEMIEYFHSHDMKIILWVTSMIDTDSSNYKEAYDKGYMLKSLLGKEALISWWHGKGGLLDYTNPQAVEWWHNQMDNVLSLGIDGWKCDGTDPYVLELVEARGKKGLVSRKEYSDYYYADFFDYTRQKNGNDTLIMSRPVDALGDILYMEFSPQRVVLSGWVGDQDPTFKGLEEALKRYIQSAWAGYPNFGSDIGGYRSGQGSLGRTKELLIRWTQLGAFSPLMENGGNKEHRPWAFDDETLQIYRNFVDIHYQLISYLLTTGSNAIETNTSSIQPLARRVDRKIDFNPSTYNYLLGTSILVAPITSDPPNVEIEFPKPGNGSSHWVYWFDRSQIYTAGVKETFTNTPLKEYTVFIATGKILPFRMNNHVVDDDNVIKWWLFLPLTSFSKEEQQLIGGDSFAMRQSHGPGIIASWRWINTSSLQVNITGHTQLRSFVQIEAPSYTFTQKTVQVTELRLTNNRNEFHFTPLQHFIGESNNNVAIKQSGVVVNENLSSISIFPKGKKELGHSFVVSFVN